MNILFCCERNQAFCQAANWQVHNGFIFGLKIPKMILKSKCETGNKHDDYKMVVK